MGFCPHIYPPRTIVLSRTEKRRKEKIKKVYGIRERAVRRCWPSVYWSEPPFSSSSDLSLDMSRKKNICHIFCGKTKVVTIRQGMEYRQVWPDFKGQHSFFLGCVKRGTLELIGKTFGEIPSASPSDLPPPPSRFPKSEKSFTPTLHLASTCKMFKTTHKDFVAPVFYTVARFFPLLFGLVGL